MLSSFTPQQAEIITIKDLDKDTRLFSLKLLGKNPHTQDGTHTFKPGQFCDVWIPGVGEIPIGYAGNPSKEGEIEIGVRRVGKSTSKLFHYSKGDKLGIRGPLGKGCFPRDEFKKRPGALIVGGTGIFPIRALILSILNEPDEFEDLTLFYGAKCPSSVLFQDEHSEWKKKFNLCLTVDECPKGEEWEGSEGLVTDLIYKEKVKSNSVVQLIGPPPMYKPVIEKLNELGIADEDIHVALERRMHCGVGTCQHCAVGSKYVCKDGPTFKYSEIRGIPGII